MPRSFGKLTQREIAWLFRRGIYHADLLTGDISNNHKVLSTDFHDGRRYVRLHYQGKRVGIARARCVWIAATGSPVPKHFEVHHRDENKCNDAWENLLCFHKKDHIKVHGQ